MLWNHLYMGYYLPNTGIFTFLNIRPAMRSSSTRRATTTSPTDRACTS